MKTSQVLILSVLAVIVSLLVGTAGFYVGYYNSLVNTTPEVIVQKVEVEKVVTKEVVVEKLVEAPVTPVPVVSAPQVTEPVSNPYESECVDSAWVVMQPKSNFSYTALTEGAIKRLHFKIKNTGTCVWENYVLSSEGVIDDIPVPYTSPGEIADILFDFPAYYSMEIRWVLQPPSNLYGVAEPIKFSNSASPGIGLETIYYRLDVKPKKQPFPYFMYKCGPNGCGFRYK